MSKIDYHEIGEIFEHDGVLLEVVNYIYNTDDGFKTACEKCFFNNKCPSHPHCSPITRIDGRFSYYKLVEQCNTKDMKQKNKPYQIYYADLTPCDDMHNYMNAGFIPSFVIEDTEKFDTMPPSGVVQVATKEGWCIVAKWQNNGSTRIYAANKDVLTEGIEILNGVCDTGNCWYAFDKEAVYSKAISHEDMQVFFGRNIVSEMQQKTEINIEKINKEMTELIKKEAEKFKTPPAGIKTIPKRRIYYKDILDKLYETYKAKDQDYGQAFSEMFDELGIDYAYGKLREKINRIKVLRNQPNMVENEGLEDALLDTAGYAILTLVELKKRKQ